MKKHEIEELVIDKHDALFKFLMQHDDNKWDKGPEGKWTTGQHIIHLVQSAKPLNKALGIPKFILQYKFGKANRPHRTYDQIVHRYQEKLKLADGKLSPFSANMPDTPPVSKEEWIVSLQKEKDVLIKKLNKLSDKQLDKYLIPHPLMGRMIMREIIMWSAYHVEHHHEILATKY